MTTVPTNTHLQPQRAKFSTDFALVAVACAMLLLSACTSAPDDEPDVSTTPPTAQQDVADDHPANGEEARRNDLEYNLQRLDDPDYTQTYGDGENDKTWYTAAENLGSIGKRAIPHLIEKLDSADEFEVMLALYALQLASQDTELQAQRGYNYLALPSVLNPRANAHNKAIAVSWWEEYRHLWDSSDG